MKDLGPSEAIRPAVLVEMLLLKPTNSDERV